MEERDGPMTNVWNETGMEGQRTGQGVLNVVVTDWKTKNLCFNYYYTIWEICLIVLVIV